MVRVSRDDWWGEGSWVSAVERFLVADVARVADEGDAERFWGEVRVIFASAGWDAEAVGRMERWVRRFRYFFG